MTTPTAGEDPAAYDDVFDQATDPDTGNLEPLIDFLEFVNNASDDELADRLPARLDIEAFATYLAFQDLVENFDDIDGPGNSSYLRWDGESGQFTVVAWDHNLAFGGILGARGPGAPGVRPGAGGPAAGGEPPDDMPSPETRGRAGDPVPPGGPASPAGGGFPDGSNVLVERFLGKEEFAALYDNAVADLRDTLFDSGLAEDILTQWSTLMTQAAALVDPDTVAREAADPRRGRARCRRLSAGQRRTTPPWRGPPLLLTHWRPWHRSADRVATSWRDRRERGGAAGAARRPRHPPAPKVPA